MSKPSNALDVFASYTYHFELHAAPTWDALSKVRDSKPSRLSTTDTEPNGTLVINTSQDLHQTIDDVVFGYIGSSTNPDGRYVPDGEMSFKVIEANGASFIQKIVNVMEAHNVTDLQSLQWGLKVVFVGRYRSNGIKSIPDNGIFIPMVFKDMKSDFTYRGGEYIMEFNTGSSFALADRGSQESVYSLSFCNMNIAVQASKVGEALKMLQDKLNENYMNCYKDSSSPNTRPLVYKINVDSRIENEYLTITGATSFQDKAPVNIVFNTNNSITDWIFQTVRSSDSLNQKVAKSLKNIRVAGHPDVNIISVLPRVIMNANNIEVIYDVTFYEGSKLDSENVIEFDFMFSDPGKNTDVLGFDIKMTSALAWFANSSVASTNAVTGQGNGDKNAANAAKKDVGLVTSSDRIIDGKVYKKTSGVYFATGAVAAIKNNNITPLPVQSGESGYNKYPTQEMANNAKFMFSTIAETHGATSPEFTFTVRGNLMMLAKGIMHPDSSALDPAIIDKHPAGVIRPLWVKVNIRSHDGKPFFYVGRYNLIGIENHFSGGIFKQLLKVIMMPDEMTKTADTPEVKRKFHDHHVDVGILTRLETAMSKFFGIKPASVIIKDETTRDYDSKNVRG